MVLGRKLTIGHNQVEMLMRRAGLKGLPGTKRRKQVHDTPTSADRVKRDFTRDRPDRLWVTDIERHQAFLNRAVVKGHRHQLVAAS
jgi:putative transposase